MAKARRKRTQYTAEQKKSILAAALKDRLTALQVKRKFGVTPVTYYSWRKKSGVAARRGRIAAQGALRGESNLASAVRGEVRAKIQAILPNIVKHEVRYYVDSLFGTRRGRRRV